MEAGFTERHRNKPFHPWVTGRFLDLLRIWTDFDWHEPMSARSVKPQVNGLNALLGLKEGGPAAFIHTVDLVPATPVPFVFQGGRAGVAVLGLNPQDRGTAEEKKTAGELPPPAYARFYTSERCLTQAVSGPYYRNLGTLLLSLEAGRLVKFSDYLRSGRFPDRAAAFAAIAARRGVLEMRLIPFYSRSWRPIGARGQARLLEHPRYGRYYEEMAALIDDAVEPDGWIIANGRDPAEVLPRLLAARAPLTDTGPPDMPYAFHRWKGRRVILLRQFLRSRGGRLNANEDLDRLFIDVSRAFRPREQAAWSQI